MKKRKVYRWLGALVVLAVLCLPAMGSSAEVNVALNKTVTLNGTMSGAAAGTLTDGVFRPRGTHWQSGTVWWNGTSSYAEIDLEGIYVINSMIAQADDNDAYLVQYHNIQTNTWETAWNVPNYDGYGSGMQTRPNPADDTERYMLSSSITTDALRFYATGGDNSYSVSEIQAYGSAVPLPGALWLFAPGLAALAGFRKKLAGARSR
ncbi:hypothetical protein SAMN04489760_10228 [Syntrophus gentianae]|uniref:F5/8 type C domain-containing protein n=1 Tax=Syntrophus gentianae TaxID=43775 RepID=A0A1H7UQQ6_9BACT|nr:hypothetical protein [Syntrophus gentianae]SEL99035.1 hypothetical protein SAMN04489760_10228 [Syntrophus gentianae]